MGSPGSNQEPWDQPQEDVRRPPLTYLHKLTLMQNRFGGVKSARTHKDRTMQADGSSDSLSTHSQPRPVWPPQVPPENHLFFIIINRIHMHGHIILLQCVDLTKHAPVVVYHRCLFAIKVAATVRVTSGYARGSTVRQ